jgi:Fe-S cluster biogenesis protein NfuA
MELTMTEDVKPLANLEDRVEQVLGKIRPFIQADGGDIELVSIDAASGKVSIRFQGACRGCPGAAMTLKMGVERHLKEQVPEVTEVLSVT